MMWFIWFHRRFEHPPIFTIYKNWAVSMERILETKLVGAMQALTANIMSLWEHHRSMDMDDQGDAQGGRGAKQEAGAPFQLERHIFICTGC
jgi:hypothetical protein